MAAEAFSGAFLDRFDTAVMITGDTDLEIAKPANDPRRVPPIRYIGMRLPLCDM